MDAYLRLFMTKSSQSRYNKRRANFVVCQFIFLQQQSKKRRQREVQTHGAFKRHDLPAQHTPRPCIEIIKVPLFLTHLKKGSLYATIRMLVIAG